MASHLKILNRSTVNSENEEIEIENIKFGTVRCCVGY